MSKVPVLTIDGPSGSGKGTVSRAAARALGWGLLDSGALYRLVALAGRRRGIALGDAERLSQMAQQFDIRFGSGPAGEEIVWLDGRDVTGDIRTEGAGNDASKVAALPQVRAALLERQRRFAVPPGLVADGRDMGTVVFPDARVKIFLTASPEERAITLRYLQRKGGKGSSNPLFFQLLMTPERPLLGACSEKNLHPRVRKYHAAHVAPVGYQSGGHGKSPLPLQQRRPHLWQRGDLGGVITRPLGADVAGYILAVQPHDFLAGRPGAEAYVELLGHLT